MLIPSLANSFSSRPFCFSTIETGLYVAQSIWISFSAPAAPAAPGKAITATAAAANTHPANRFIARPSPSCLKQLVIQRFIQRDQQENSYMRARRPRTGLPNRPPAQHGGAAGTQCPVTALAASDIRLG